MATKHTPGNWKSREQGEANEYYIGTDHDWLMFIRHNGEQGIKEQQANIQLMVTAPELLQALEQCIKLLSPSAIVMDVHKEMVRNDALETIKKATE